jgi:hypothetical protein
MAPRPTLTSLALALLGALALACSGGDIGGGGGDSGPPLGDGGLPFGDGATPAIDGPASNCASCPPQTVCYGSTCVPDEGPCSTDEDCQGDTFCHQGTCVPYGPGTKDHDPNCKNGGFTPEQLEQPVLKCKWAKEGVRMSPVVADLDGDGKPEIIFITQGSNLVAIKGDTCQEVFKVKGSYTIGANPAVADLDGDGKPEIISVTKADLVVVHDRKGKQIAIATEKPKRHFKETSGGPAIANLDQTGRPEIVYGGMALRLNTNNTLKVLFNKPVHGGYRGVFSVVADVDLDGKPDIISGNAIYDGQTGADKTPANIAKLKYGGHVAVAQFDKATPEPEIVLIRSETGVKGEIIVFHPVTGKIVFGPYTFGQQRGGPPTVADFDGDGEPEVAAAGHVGYAVFDMECATTPLPTFCHSPGMRWLKQTQDKSSGCTGSSVFDFNGDGKAEVVYRDECWLRVYDGTTGKIRFAATVTSGTKHELPVVVDVDNDNHADIVMSSDSYLNCAAKEPELGLKHGGATKGILVFQDPQNKWMPSRAIWNQHTYHITNVNDDGTIPVKEKNNWDSWNNFRQNVQGIVQTEIPATDMTSDDHKPIDPTSDCKKQWKLNAKMCNRGVETAAAGVPGSFYDGDPRQASATYLCTATTSKTLAPGECEIVSCTVDNPPQEKWDLWFKADDDGKKGDSEVECKEQNNYLHMPGAVCNSIG